MEEEEEDEDIGRTGIGLTILPRVWVCAGCLAEFLVLAGGSLSFCC